MKLCIAGLNHRTAPVAVRERLAFSPADLPRAVMDLR
jgi:glutamyl-tRNA reductase